MTCSLIHRHRADAEHAARLRRLAAYYTWDCPAVADYPVTRQWVQMHLAVEDIPLHVLAEYVGCLLDDPPRSGFAAVEADVFVTVYLYRLED